MKSIGLSLFFTAFGLSTLFAQCPATDFPLNATACLNQNIYLTNNSSPGSFLWDFCSGDFENTPSASDLITIDGAAGRPAIDLVKDNGTWYGFVTGFAGNALYRLTFLNGPDHPPTSTISLGNLGGKLNQPGQVRIILENGEWIGILHNTATAELLRLDFGGALTNTVSTVTTLATGVGFNNSGLAVGRDAVNGWVAVISQSGQFQIIRLGVNVQPATAGDMITSTNVSSTADVDLVNVCGSWYGFAVANFGSPNVYRLDFGANLFSSPGITLIGKVSASDLGRARIVREGESYYLFVVNLDLDGRPLFKLSFGTDITSTPAIATESNLSNVPVNMYGLAVAKENSTWTVMVMSQATGRAFQILYPDHCSSSQKTSTTSTPQVAYTSAGQYQISLENTVGTYTGVKARVLTVLSTSAPDLAIAYQNICVNSNVNFSVVNASNDLTNFDWDFGDSNTAVAAAPSHAYSATGNYDVRLTATSSSGCKNTTDRTLTIYNPPATSFALPSPGVSCTNQQYLFTNTSTFDAGTAPAWTWSVDGADVSSAKDFSQAFSSVATKSINLTGSIPGCSTSSTQSFGIQAVGPMIDFATDGHCQTDAVSLSSTTSGTVTGYTWDFGDGQNGSTANVQHSFNSIGTFDIKLTGTNAAGCVNSATKALKIYSKPSAAFMLELPPFSCSGTPSQFTDTTPPLTDSNISEWAWMFGDPTLGTSSEQNPSFTYADAGSYQVDLTVTTDFGCKSSLQKSVTISAAPAVDFTTSIACKDKETQLIDKSESGVTSWTWRVGTASYNTQNAEHLFTSVGQQNITLYVVGANSCRGQSTKSIIVPVPPLLDFSYSRACANDTATFISTTPTGNDNPVSFSWNFGGSGVQAMHIFGSTGVEPVTLEVIAQSGCTYDLTKQVQIAAGPTADFSYSQVGLDEVQFQNASAGALSYKWFFGDPQHSTSAAVSPQFMYPASGVYVVQLVATGALSCVGKTSKSVSVGVLGLEPDFEMQPYPNPATNEISFRFAAATVGTVNVRLISASGIMAAQWTFNVSEGQQQISMQVSSVPDGMYLVQVFYNDVIHTYRVIKVKE